MVKAAESHMSSCTVQVPDVAAQKPWACVRVRMPDTRKEGEMDTGSAACPFLGSAFSLGHDFSLPLVNVRALWQKLNKNQTCLFSL